MTRYFEVGSHYSNFLSLCAPRLINIYTVRVGKGWHVPLPPAYSVDNQVIFPFQLVKRVIF